VIEGPTGKLPVVLYLDQAVHALRVGDVATVVDFVELPSSGPAGWRFTRSHRHPPPRQITAVARPSELEGATPSITGDWRRP